MTKVKRISEAHTPEGNLIITAEQFMGFSEAKETAAKESGRLLSMKEFIRTLKDHAHYLYFSGHEYWLNDEGRLDVHGYCRIDYD